MQKNQIVYKKILVKNLVLKNSNNIVLKNSKNIVLKNFSVKNTRKPC